MPTSRKDFLKKFSCILAGSALPYKKLFAEFEAAKPDIACLNTSFDCIDLRTPIYNFTVDQGTNNLGISFKSIHACKFRRCKI